MSLRLETLQVARLAPKLLGESAELVRDFVFEQLAPSGGFVGRDGTPDLYYTVFGLDCLVALQAELPAEVTRSLAGFLSGFGDGDGLDLVHLACLTHCRAALAQELPAASDPDRLLERVLGFRTPDGGFHVSAGAKAGTVYGCYLALGAAHNLGRELPESCRDGMRGFLATMRTADGAWANDRDLHIGSTPATAAGVALSRNLGWPVPDETGPWLEARLHARGGFLAMPTAPMPDLLSTAVALHALDGLRRPIEPLKDPCLDFLDSLWVNRGSFFAHWADDRLDCEYTFYALLALGHLSL